MSAMTPLRVYWLDVENKGGKKIEKEKKKEIVENHNNNNNNLSKGDVSVINSTFLLK